MVPTRRPRREGGVGKWAFMSPPPPLQSNFLPAHATGHAEAVLGGTGVSSHMHARLVAAAVESRRPGRTIGTFGVAVSISTGARQPAGIKRGHEEGGRAPPGKRRATPAKTFQGGRERGRGGGGAPTEPTLPPSQEITRPRPSRRRPDVGRGRHDRRGRVAHRERRTSTLGWGGGGGQRNRAASWWPHAGGGGGGKGGHRQLPQNHRQTTAGKRAV